MPAAENDALEAALDELYAADPDDFVATRKRLAAELRGAGDEDAAKALQGARRPTTAVGVLNQLSREAPELIESFLDLSGELQAAQTGAGGREAIRDATRAQRSALAEATDAAVARLGDRSTDAYRAQILATLQAASANETVASELRKGRLVREVSGATGFPEGPGLTLVPDLPAKEAKAKPTRDQPKRAPKAKPSTKGHDAGEDSRAKKAEEAERRRVEREREALERAERRQVEADAASDAAHEDAEAAEETATEVHQRIERLERELTEARRAVREADDRAGRARREATRLARMATKLRSRTAGKGGASE